MNQRLRELAAEADAWCDQNHCGSEFYDVRWEEKFAELIVRECAGIVYQTCRDGDAGAQAILYEFDIDNARSQK